VTAADPALAVSGLDSGYGETTICREVSFEVARGETLVIVGPNGHGKTTLLRTISGLLRPTAGEISLEGRRIDGMRAEARTELGLIHIPQGDHLFGELTVEENLRLGLAGRGKRSNGDGLARAYELFPVLREFRSRNAGALSGGQQQQLAIGRALAADPTVLLLDEPSLGLAPKIVDVVFEALAQIKEAGFAVLLVEQRAQRTVALADHSYVLANGELRLTLGPEDAGDTDRLVAAYLA
jgi:branched-chain amino acid transport system ATP-binding protein